MPACVQLLVALAVTGLLSGFDCPFLLAMGALAGVGPDFLAWMLSPLLPWPDLQVTPDPACPQAATVANGLLTAARETRAAGRKITVRLNPSPVPGGASYLGYELDLDPRQRAGVTMGDQSAHLAWQGWLPRHPLPLKVSATAVELVLTPLDGGRFSTEVAPIGHPAGHTWLWPPTLLAGMAVWPEAAFTAAVVVSLHLALDYGGKESRIPLWPLSARIGRGPRGWGDENRIAVFMIGGLAALALALAAWPEAGTPGSALLRARVFMLAAALAAGIGYAARRRR